MLTGRQAQTGACRQVRMMPHVLTVLMLVAAGCLGGCAGSLNSDAVSSLAPTGPATAVAADKVGAAGPKSAAIFVRDTSSVSSTKIAKVADALTSSATPGNAGYKIGPQDLIEVSVFKVPELSKSAQVADTGTINLPLIGETMVVGKTAQQVERDLTAKLGSKYLHNPQVTVLVKEYNSQRVTMEGAVKKPGVYPVRGKNTLLQFIALAEGLDPNADSTVVVFRQIDGKRSVARFDVSEIQAGTSPDPEIVSGDVIVAGSSAIKETFNNILKALPIASVFAHL